MLKIPYARHFISPEDISAVNDVLKSDFLTQGEVVKNFESHFAKYVGANFASVASNGTAALHLACLALGVNEQSTIITTPITFAASANAVRFCGGKVHFVDIDPESYLIDLNKIEAVLDSNPIGTFQGIIPVDFAGYPVNLEKLHKIAEKYNLFILEDACHSPGGYFIDSKGNKQYCGNCTYNDLSVFSFHPVKHIAAGEGGLITSNNSSYRNKINLFRNHGITKEEALMNENHGGWYYEMQDLGYNYRLTDIQAALALSQLKRAEPSLLRRKQIAKRYDEAFVGKNLIPPKVEINVSHAYHLYVIKVDDRKGLYDHLKKNGIFAQIHYIPVHLHPYYRSLGWKKGDFPVAEEYYEKCISLPLFPSLSYSDQEYVIDKVLEFTEK